MSLDDKHLTLAETLKQWLEPSPKGSLASIAVTAGGTGYTSAPTVTISDATGGGATATASVVGGAVTAIIVVSAGNNYSVPTVTVTGGGGSGAAATAAVENDAAIAKLITDVSAAILNQANIDRFYDTGTPITETRNGNGRNRMTLKNRPITSVVSVKVDGVLIPQSLGAHSCGWLFDEDVLYLDGYAFTTGVRNVVVVLTAGEAQGSQNALIAERAAIATATLWWKRHGYAHLTNESASQGMGVSLGIQTADFPPEALALIKNLTRVTYAV